MNTVEGMSADIDPAPEGETADPLREQALERLRRKRKFRIDAITYVFINAVVWGIWALTGAEVSDDGIPWPLWVSGIWGALLVLDAIKAFGDSGITDSDIDAEMGKMQDRR